MSAPKGSLTHATLSGLVWTGVGKGAFTLIDVLVLVVLSRLLTPADFGIVSAALVVVRFSTIFTRIGFGPALVQMEELEPRHVQTAFVLSIGLGTIMAAALHAGSSLFAAFFRDPAIGPVVAALAWTLPLKGYAAVAQSLVKRDFEFKWLARLEVVSFGLGYALFGIGLAVLGAGPWALVGAQVSQAGLRTVMLLTKHRPSTRAGIDRAAAGQLVRFGGGLSAGRLANFLAQEGDYIVVGRFLGPIALGLYTRAYRVMGAPVALMGKMLDSVLFPAMARVQSEPERLRRAYRRGLALVALTTLPLAAVLFVLAPELIAVVLGAQWGEVVAPFRILALGLFFGTSYRMADSLSRATGVVYARAWRQAVYAAVVLVAAWLGTRQGLAGVAAGVLFALFVNFLLMSQLGRRVTGLSWADFVRTHVPALVLAALAGGVAWAAATPLRAAGAADAIVVAGPGVLLAGLAAFIVLGPPRRLLGEDGVWMLDTLRSFLSRRRAPERGGEA